MSISLAVHNVARVSAELIEYSGFHEMLLTLHNHEGERVGGISFISTKGAPVLEVDGTPRKSVESSASTNPNQE